MEPISGVTHEEKIRYGIRNVESLTDRLLHSIFHDDRAQELSPPEEANQSTNLLTYRITQMADTAMCFTPVIRQEAHYTIPEIDIQKMTSVGVAMAMLILAAMQTEIMLDTQMEGIRGSQNQKLSSHQTSILKIKQQIRKARYKSPFQKFMERLNNSGFMKFMNSQLGKIIMFVIGAIITAASIVASVFTGGMSAFVALAVISFLIGATTFAVEMATGKSVGQLAAEAATTNEKDRMAIQMAIDIGLMVAQIALSAGSSAGAGADVVNSSVDAAKEATEIAQQATKVAQQASEVATQAAKIADAAGSAADTVADIASTASEAVDTANKVADAAKNLAKSAEALSEGISKGTKTAADVAKETAELTKQMGELTEQIGEMTKKLSDLTGMADQVTNITEISAATKAIENIGKIGEISGGMEKIDEFIKAKDTLDTITKIQKASTVINTIGSVMTQLEGSLYGLAMSEDQVRKLLTASTIEAIRIATDAEQDFKQMLIDNQMSDIRALMSYTKAAYERAAAAIQEYGEINRMIAQNLVI